MAENNPYAGPRWVGFTMAGIAAATLLTAVIDTPLGDWTSGNYLFGAILVVFIVVFALAGIRGQLNLVGRWSGKTTLIISIVGTVAAVLAIVGTLLSGELNLDSILTTGTWLALLVMFAASISVARKKMRAGS